MTPRGFEHSPQNIEKTQKKQGGNVKSNARPDALPADLASVVAAWPHLPEPIKRAILALLGAS